ncbi:Polyketide transferase af380 [Metarhizium brunneum]|uniref:Polyketide transferase af380 n=1 Tax=Metarhizium brunneum TaxID=500148 RepID=A0A7D5YX97_9HYPO
MPPSRETVEFKACDGTVLRGWFYPQEKPAPCIIMTHGLAGIRHFRLPRFATRFHEAGYTVLLYDNRNWGDSDGTPRQESNPALQQTDYYDAFNYALTKACVDPKQIVYWGTSFSGGNVIYAAAVDKRIKAAIVQAPAVSGETRSVAFADQIPFVFQDRARIAAGKQPRRVPVIASSREAAEEGSENVMFPGTHVYDQIEEQLACGGQWENYVTSQTQLHMLEFEAQAMIHRISPTPLLMVVPGNDVLVSTSSQLAAFGKAREPKQLVYLEGVGHFDIYTGDAFDRNIDAQLDFLRRHLTT